MIVVPTIVLIDLSLFLYLKLHKSTDLSAYRISVEQ